MPMPMPGRPEPGPAPAKPIAWNEAELVFAATLEQAVPGPVAQSMPPIYNHTLHFTVKQTIRGELRQGDKLVCHHAARQLEAPEFPVNQVCLVAARQVRGSTEALAVERADDRQIAEVKQACALPLGWKIEAGKPVSPWAALGTQAWPETAAAKAELTCSKTGRPALMAGGKVEFEVEMVPPAREIKWTNPDGDGEYRVTVRNPTDQPLTVPALLTDGQNILWENSLVILCQGRAYPCPGFRTDARKAAPTTLEPGQSVTQVINALRLEGPNWPRGGMRVEFQFCLGEKSRTKSFYYMSRHHDVIRRGSGSGGE